MTSIRQICARWWPSALCVAIILYATLSTDPAGADKLQLFPGADKLIHAIMFGGLAGAIAFDFCRSNPTHRVGRRLMTAIAIAVITFGALDEAAQAMLTDNRSAEWLDFAADCTGVAVAWLTAPAAVRKCVELSARWRRRR